jgi:hypothetical protein
VVAFSSSRATAVVFSRRLAGRILTFTNLRREKGELLMDDLETRSIWRAFSGESIHGKLEGTRLGQLPSTVGFWFAWKGFYPETLVWKP